MLVRKRLRITGRVQGVAFRASTVTAAHALGLAGWVANRADGSVEAVAEGTRRGLQCSSAGAIRGRRQRVSTTSK